ncbi:hypothetical protein LZ636_15325 [Proteus terrae]|uniref:hypothetical protein n=1 Tax=Proteus terrae TaxID=1574161 RepID=UPI001F3FB2F1|nr:hypothetical protein [Proteus terrae]MCE9841051.1 hypothetical protein [Proteus terrae]
MSLFLTIISTSIFCVLTLLPIYLTMKNRISENKKNTSTENEISKEKRSLFSLDERNLQSQPMFWSAIASPLIVGVLLFAVISPNYDLNFTFDAYKTFMEIAQLPSVILALSPILGAFVMYAHRSYQTDIQIKTAKEQLGEAQNKNKIDRYFSKRKSIYDQLSLIRTENNEKIINPVGLYLDSFITNNYEDNISNEFLDKVNLSISKINKHISILNQYVCYSNVFQYKFKEIKFGENLIYSIHDFEHLDREIKRIKELFYLKCDSSDLKSSISIYKKYCNVIDEIDNQNIQNNMNEFDIRFRDQKIDYMCHSFFIESVDIIKDLFKFIYIVFSILNSKSNLDNFLPALIDSKNKCDQWDKLIDEYRIF